MNPNCDVCGEPILPDDEGQSTADAVVCEHCCGRLTLRAKMVALTQPAPPLGPDPEWDEFRRKQWEKYSVQWVETARRHATPQGFATLGYERGPDRKCWCPVCRLVRDRAESAT